MSRALGSACAAVVALLVALTATLAQSPANSAFTASTANAANRADSGSVAPVTGLTATPRCGGAPPTHQASTYDTASSGSTTVRLTVPAGTQAGDLVLVHVERNSTTAPTAPAGFSLVRSDTATGIGSWVYQKVATATDTGTAYTWAVSGSAGSGVLSTYRGAAGISSSTETAGQALSTNSNTAEMPSVTAGVPNSLLVFLISAQAGTASSTSPGVMTRVYATVSRDHAFYGFTEVRTATGPTGTRVANLSATSPLAVVALLLRPAAQVDVAWTASASTIASGYEVRRDGALVTTLTGRTTTTWTDSPAPAGSHTWTVTATSGYTWRSTAVPATATLSC